MRVGLSVCFCFFLAIVHAATISGLVLNKETDVPISDATILLYSGEKHITTKRSGMEGSFSIPLKKGKHYTLTVFKDGYQNETASFEVTPQYLKEMTSIVVYLSPLRSTPVFNEMEEGMTDPVPNPDIMEDIGDLSNLPPEYKIIDAQPIQFSEKKKTNFNVSLHQDPDPTYVNVVTLKEMHERKLQGESIQEIFQENTPSSFYAEESIFYETGKAYLSNSVKHALIDFVERLLLNTEEIMIIRAYADDYLEHEAGDYLSKLRAEEVVQFMLQHDIPFERLEVSVIGNKHLFNECYHGIECSEWEHQQNRRVDLSFR